MLHRTLPDPEGWNVTILATDINPRFLRKAVAAEFGEWSFRDVPAAFRDAIRGILLQQPPPAPSAAQ